MNLDKLRSVMESMSSTNRLCMVGFPRGGEWFLVCSVTKSCLTVCNPTDCSTPGFIVLHYLPELAQTQVH